MTNDMDINLSVWKEKSLAEISEIQTGPFGSQLHEKDYVAVGTPIITVEHLLDDRITHEYQIPQVSEEDTKRLNKYSLREGDIVFSRVGSVDRSAYVSNQENNWLFSGRLLRIRPNSNEVDALWLNYWLRQESIKKYVRRIAVGATMPSINTNLIGTVPVLLPPIPYQRKVAQILSSFDNKIINNQKINSTLEGIMSRLYKYLFSNFESIKKSIQEEYSFIKGFEPGAKNYLNTHSEDTTRFYRVANLYNGSRPKLFILNSLAKIERASEEDVLISTDGTVGRVAVGLNGYYSAGIRKIVEKSTNKSDPFIYLYLKSDYVQNKLKEHSANATTIAHAGGAIKELKIPLNQEIRKKYNLSCRPFYEKIIQNLEENNQLTDTRNLLLSGLMTGKIRVPINDKQYV